MRRPADLVIGGGYGVGFDNGYAEGFAAGERAAWDRAWAETCRHQVDVDQARAEAYEQGQRYALLHETAEGVPEEAGAAAGERLPGSTSGAAEAVRPRDPAPAPQRVPYSRR